MRTVQHLSPMHLTASLVHAPVPLQAERV